MSLTINDHELVQLFVENGVHEGREHQWNIAKPGWHHQELIKTILGPHCYFFHILICDEDLIIPQFEINLVKTFCLVELIQYIVNVG
jgi:antibiotic biosynthesis monooxygenase (ABM) superfamily enzyme